LAHSKSALKRWRQNEAHRARNKPVRTAARTAVKKARTAIAGGTTDDAAAAIREAASILDRAAKRNIIHKNAASRQKSRMMRHLNQAGDGTVKAEAPKKARKTASKGTAAKKTAPKVKAATKPKATTAKKTTTTKKKTDDK
jgi:small subunit ribosomal protein S20